MTFLYSISFLMSLLSALTTSSGSETSPFRSLNQRSVLPVFRWAHHPTLGRCWRILLGYTESCFQAWSFSWTWFLLTECKPYLGGSGQSYNRLRTLHQWSLSFEASSFVQRAWNRTSSSRSSRCMHCICVWIWSLNHSDLVGWASA